MQKGKRYGFWYVVIFTIFTLIIFGYIIIYYNIKNSKNIFSVSMVNNRIPLLFLGSGKGVKEFVLFYGFWEPGSGLIHIHNEPILIFSGKEIFNTKELGAYWEGRDEIYFSEGGGSKELTSKSLKLDFHIKNSKINVPFDALYLATKEEEYAVFSKGNQVILRKNSQGHNEDVFAVFDNSFMEVVPLLLNKRGKEIFILVDMMKTNGTEELYLIKISGKSITWIDIIDSISPHCSYIAGAGVKVGISGSNIYLSSPCSGEILYFNLEKKPYALLPVKQINDEVKLVEKMDPSEGTSLPHFGNYDGIVLVDVVTGGPPKKTNETEWLFAFRNEVLIGKMALDLGEGKIKSFSSNKETETKGPLNLKGILLPTIGFASR